MVLITGIVTTFMLWTSLADPIDIPKMFVLVTLSFWILGTIASAFPFKDLRKLSIGHWSVLAFALGILIAAVMSDVRYTAFFGTPQRNDGAFSYLALAIIALAAMASFDREHTFQLRTGLLIVGAFLTLYGLVQRSGHDPFKWVLEYGPVIGTLGNPDFMSATVGVSAIATVWMLLESQDVKVRAGATILLLLELFILRQTGSVQGELAFAFGLVVLVLTKLWQKGRRQGLTATIVAAIGAIPVLFGLLDKGPLASHLFRASMKNRMDYWHAALGMFKAHPLFGVGLERFGENYGVYAPQVQVVQGQATNNAHSVLLQLLATGGLVVFLPYLLVIVVIFWTSFKAIKVTKGQAQIDVVAILAIWSALLLVSLISIDNLGVAVWFWISGGVLYAIAHEANKKDRVGPKPAKPSSKKSRKAVQSNASYVAPILSFICVLLALIPMTSIWRTSAAVVDLQSNRSQLSPAQFLDKMNSVAGIQPRNAQTLYALSDIAMRIKNPTLALKYVKIVLEKDPKSNSGRQLAAIAYETQKNYQSAIPFRAELLTLDPWNTANMVLLIKDYLQVKDMTKATQLSAKIAQLYPGSADATTAEQLVKG